MPDVWLSLTNRDMLLNEADRVAPRETGGVLIGYKATDGIVITHVLGPGPDASHERHRFTPDHAYHEEEIARVYQETSRLSTYLGDWHTHPGGSPRLSTTDRRTLGRIATTSAARCPKPLMLIISGGTPWMITIHRRTTPGWYGITKAIPIIYGARS